MKPAARHFLMSASLVCSALILFMWIRSYAVSDSYQWSRYTPGTPRIDVKGGRVVTGLGGLGIWISHTQTSDPVEAERYRLWREQSTDLRQFGYRSNAATHYPIRWASDQGPLASLGFYGGNFVTDTSATHRWRFSITVPFWALFILTAGYPVGRYVWGVLQRQREERVALGLCPRCGVPMNRELSRCPGCNRRFEVIHHVPETNPV